MLHSLEATQVTRPSVRDRYLKSPVLCLSLSINVIFCQPQLHVSQTAPLLRAEFFNQGRSKNGRRKYEYSLAKHGYHGIVVFTQMTYSFPSCFLPFQLKAICPRPIYLLGESFINIKSDHNDHPFEMFWGSYISQAKIYSLQCSRSLDVGLQDSGFLNVIILHLTLLPLLLVPITVTILAMLQTSPPQSILKLLLPSAWNSLD